MASSSSTSKPCHLLNHLYGGATTAPPPTPSTQPSFSSSDATADTLSRLLHRLPPSLSLPTRRLSPRAAALGSSSSSPLPIVSLSSTSSFELGYFQLKTHSITSQLGEAAESEAAALFELPLEERFSSFPKDWPLGFNYDDEDDDQKTGSFCFNGECSVTGTTTGKGTELKLASLRELTRELEKLALEVVEKLACTAGFDNPFKEGNKHSSLMWVSSSDGDKGMLVYPYVVGLQYQIRPTKWDLLSDSGSVTVEPHVGSVLVTLGDIAQVWSNGKLKKVRGRPTPIIDDKKPSISMTLLLTLPLESMVSPLIRKSIMENKDHDKEECEPEKDQEDCHESQRIEDENVNNDDENEDPRVFNSFSFEDYAWRVFHERLHIKEPLDRYRVTN